jgi:hypothetical protein
MSATQRGVGRSTPGASTTQHVRLYGIKYISYCLINYLEYFRMAMDGQISLSTLIKWL